MGRGVRPVVQTLCRLITKVGFLGLAAPVDVSAARGWDCQHPAQSPGLAVARLLRPRCCASVTGLERGDRRGVCWSLEHVGPQVSGHCWSVRFLSPLSACALRLSGGTPAGGAELWVGQRQSLAGTLPGFAGTI